MIDELKEELIMILKNQTITDIRIEDVNDLYKLIIEKGKQRNNQAAKGK